MLQKMINSVLQPRHFWRTIGFDELSELYASMLLRSLALSLIGLFVPIYLYKLGYTITEILGFFTVFFLVRIPVDIVVAFIVGRIGPKHCIALSTLGNIVYLVMLLTISDLHWPLYALAAVGTLTNSLFFIAFHTDFSKVKHSEHGGKELSYLMILEKIGGVLGPLIGGLLATFTDAKYTIVLAITVFAASLVPLLATKEVVRVHQHVTFKGLPLKKHWRHFTSYACFDAENTISVLLWTFYISLVVFTTGTYAKIGAIAALTTALSIIVANMVGKRVDKKQGKKLRNRSVVINAVIHGLRPFVITPFGAIAISLANDPVTIMYRMPFIKQFYDTADSLPGYRIAFIAASESIAAILRFLVWGAMFVLSLYIDPITAIKCGFFTAVIFSLGIALQPYRYNNQK